MKLNKIAKLTGKETANYNIDGLLFTNDKVVVTDRCSLLEANYPAGGVSAIIPANYFRAGDVVTEQDGQPVITRKDGGTLTPDTKPVDNYPDYQRVMPAEDAEGATLDVDRKRLIELLEAMPEDGEKNNKITLKIRTDKKDHALKITNKEATGILMPQRS